MLRLEARNSQTPIERKPPWIKTRLRTGPGVHRAEAAGPARGPAHGLRGGRLPEHLRVLGGPRGHLPHRRRPVHPALRLLPDRHRQAAPLDTDEPRRVAESVATMGLRYATVTGVARDDLPDGGAWLYAQTVREIHAAVPGCGVELLDPRLQRRARPAGRGVRRPARGARAQHRDGAADLPADPARLPLRALARRAARGPRGRAGHQVQPDPRAWARSGDEVTEAMRTCARPAATCSPSPSTCGPSPRHHPVERWVKPEEFVELREEARDRLRRRDVRPAGALVLPGRAAVPPGDRAARRSARHSSVLCGTHAGSG